MPMTSNEQLRATHKIMEQIYDLAVAETDHGFACVTIEADSLVWFALCELALEWQIQLPKKDDIGEMTKAILKLADLRESN